MGNLLKFKFEDRDDLISKIVLKKSDIPNSETIINGLTESLKRYKRGDKKAMQEVIKLRKRMLNAAAETYIELKEDGMFEAVVKEIKVLDYIDETDNKDE